MAKPRVFLSSTFYDLRQMRSDLEAFVLQLGYDCVRNERGQISYGPEKSLEQYCYREIDACDIVVSIIGGRFGSASESAPYSISQMELKTAIRQGKSLYVFVEKSVYAEYRTYLLNKEAQSIKYHFVDDIRVYKFIEEVDLLPKNNPMASFEGAADITAYLREQWAGLFQRFLQEQNRVREKDLLDRIEATANTLDRVMTYIGEGQGETADRTLQEIVLTNHPVFQKLQDVLSVRYRVFFTTKHELDRWLTSRTFSSTPADVWDEPGIAEWTNNV